MSTQDAPKLTSLRITAEREIKRREELADIYSALVGEADIRQGESERLRGLAERIRLLINDDTDEICGKMPVKSEAQRRRDAARSLRSVAANLEK